MKKTKILSLLLCLSLFCALIVPGTRAYADNEPDSGMKISKTATANADGSYTIMLEAYATGEKVISEITKDVPTDIILVLDQSGSMANDIGTVSFEQYEDETDWWGNVSTYHTRNQDYYEYRHNGGSGNLWHKLADESYVSVSVKRQEKVNYTAITNGKNNSTSDGATNYWSNQENLYALVDGEYLKVTVERTKYNGTYTYTLPDGTRIASQSGANKSPTFTGIEGNVIYLAAVDDAATTYTYTYTDSNENVQTIRTSTGAETVFSPTLYQRVIGSGGGSKLNALKSAVTSFVNNVNQKALGADGRYGTADDVAHRIAIVGFASNSRNENTELLSTERATDYWSANAANYRDALVSACGTNGGVNSRLTTAIDRLDASGDTYLEYGMDMANKIFAQYPITAEDTSGRQRVVVVFTDGYPAPSGTDDFKYSMANNAIQNANVSKQTYGATVYTVGVFNTADPTADIETNFATSDGWYDSWGGSGNNLTEQQEAVAANRYMHYVSSNFPGATSLNQGGSMNPNANPFAGGGSYYLSAADAGSLNNIFKQISDQIETGGSSSTLTSDAVVKDIISPQFTLPEGATASDITLETYACTGKDGENYTWSKNTDAMGARATISGDQVNVTGFNFSENWCGTETDTQGTITVRGKKLVISFKVQPKAGFLGGNDVITNTSAGVYENSSAENPVMTFDQPQVDVTIKKPDITLPDANVYLGAYFSETVNADDLKAGTSIKFGDNIVLDLTKPDQNWGLEDWQTEYVTIEVKVTDKDGHEVTSFEKLTEDTEYKVSVSIKPKTPKAENNGYDESMAGTIHVFKPELTFKDSTAYYGESVPENNNYSGNYVANSEKWKNGGKYSTDDGVQMLGAKPTLDISYAPDENKLESGKYTKQDVPVSATVKIGTENVNGHTTFVHQDCTGKTCELPEGYHFWIHIQTCTLNITKQGGAADESYVFDVFKDGVKYSEVTVEGNTSQTLYELPIGNYTILENTGWSWRYNADNGSGAALSAANPNGSITCTNSSNGKIYWLNGFSQVVRNIFGISH